MVKLICKTCGKEFEVHKYRKNTAKYCSQKCSNKNRRRICFNTGKTHFKKGFTPWNKNKKTGIVPWNKGKKLPRGKNAYCWKGGKKIEQGYTFIYQPFHPFANKSKYVREHRLVIEKQIGRYLLPEEKTHHLNEIKTDNRIKNLMCFINNSAHMRFHFNPNNVKPSEIIFDGRKLK